MNQLLKKASISFNIIAFVLAAMLIVNRTYGFQKEIKIGFYIFGAIALILSFINAKNDQEQTFNPLFWIGTLVIFIGLVFKTANLPYSYYIIIGGGLITGISYLFNPMSTKKEENSDLLDN
jgi:hypothetical protein